MMWHERADTQIVEPGDLAFWQGLWRTDAFRALMADPTTGYGNLLVQASRMPWWFVSAEQSYERRHFSVWFGQAIIRRHYENPVIEDLYYFHDLLHALTFVDGSRMDESAWRLAMRANEIAVSMETEVLVYWRSPALRPQSFRHAIWHDQITPRLAPDARERLVAYRAAILRDTACDASQHEAALVRAVPAWPLEHVCDATRDLPDRQTLWDLRRAISLSPHAGNEVEMELAKYENQAEPFYDAWSQQWREVERERAVFADLCSQGRWKEAVVRRHRIWQSVSNEDGVPYGDRAQALA